jgi:hypothetical protein
VTPAEQQETPPPTPGLHRGLASTSPGVPRRDPAPPPPKPQTLEKWGVHVCLDARGAPGTLDLSRGTLEQRRVRGDGPPFIELGGGVRYDAVGWRSGRAHASGGRQTPGTGILRRKAESQVLTVPIPVQRAVASLLEP